MQFSTSSFRLGFLLRALALACALWLSRWANLPWVAMVGLVLLGIGASLASAGRSAKWRSWSLGLIWLATLIVVVAVLFSPSKRYARENFLDPYFGVLAWLIATTLWPVAAGGQAKATEAAEPSSSANEPPAPSNLKILQARWKLPAFAWLVMGTFLWLAGAYFQNLRGPFYIGLAAAVGTLILCLIYNRLPVVVVQAAVTLALLCIGLPLADLVLNPAHRGPENPQILKQYSSYQAAQKNRSGFEAWWNYFWNQWLALSARIVVYEPQASVPVRLRSKSEGWLVQSHIRINSQGFRGPEIPADKGRTLRIVALGESTTFGFTINADDRPWPELLEQLIRERLQPRRPIQVVNAGLPSADLMLNLKRFPSQILPLHPDLIICYHGFNGFHLLDRAVPKASGELPPVYRPRPLRLLADCEYRLRLMLYRRAHNAEPPSPPPTFANLMDTDLARAYRELISITASNHIQLAIANFSMAANASSPPELVEFFHPRTPAPYRMIQANAAQTRLLRRLAAEHPEIRFVDTHPGLDGDPNQFIDLIHFIHQGERRMAENIFDGIRPLLEKAVASAPP